MATGTIVELWRFPVKSMGGERAGALRVDDRGAAGDRTHAVWREHKGRPVPLTAREAPRLLAWRARYDEPGETLALEDPPEPQLHGPAGEAVAWADAAAPLAADLGREVELRRDVAGQQDLERSLLITTVATHAALEAEVGHPLDPRRWRTNVLVDLDAGPFAEHGWEGRRMTLGNVEVELLHPCARCAIPTRDPDTQAKDPGLLKHLVTHHDTLFGINARVVVPGTLREGDAVSLSGGASPR